MNSKNQKLLKYGMCALAVLLLGFEVFRCTSGALDRIREPHDWGWWCWFPCFYSIFLLAESFFSTNRKARITTCALLGLDLLADFCILFKSDLPAGPFLWSYLLPVLAGMIALLIFEDNGFLKKMNVFTLVITVVGAFSVCM